MSLTGSTLASPTPDTTPFALRDSGEAINGQSGTALGMPRGANPSPDTGMGSLRPKTEPTLIAAGPLVVVAGVGLTAWEAATVLGILALAAWQLSQAASDAERSGILDSAKQKIIDSGEQCKQLVEQAWGSLVSSMQTVSTLGGNFVEFMARARDQLSQMLTSNNGSSTPAAGTVSGNTPTRTRQPSAPTQTTTPVTPTRPAPVSTVPAATPTPVALQDLPIGRQQIALNQSGIDNVTAARQSMARGSALLPNLNQSLRQFYFDASGGVAARSQGVLQRSIAQVQQIKDQLSQIVSGSNESVAGIRAAARALQRIYGNPANAGQLFSDLSQSISGLNQAYAEQSGVRNDFKALVNRLDTWLSQAYKHAADGFQALPAPPLPVLSPAGTDPNAVATGLQTAAQNAQQSLDRSNTQRSQPAAVAPAAVTAPNSLGWMDPTNGALSSQRSALANVPVTARWADTLPSGGQRFSMNVDANSGQPQAAGDPNPGVPVEGTMKLDASGLTVHLRPGGGKDPDPNWRNKVLAALGTVGVTAFFASGQVQFAHTAAEDRRVGTLQPDFVNAERSAQTLLNGLGPNSSEADVKAAREAVWRNYFEAANGTLQGAQWQRVLNIPGLGGGSMFSSNDMQQIRAEQERFLVGLRSQPVPSRNGGEIGLGAFNRAPVLEGDPLKTQHFNSVMQKVNTEVRQQLALVPGRTAGDAKVGAFTPRPFDVNAYVRDHGSELASDAGRKQAHVTLWRHHLNQVLPALGNSRTTAEQREAFRLEAERWLSSENLDPTQLILLPGNADAQPVLASSIAAARRDVDRLEAQMPKRPSMLDDLRRAPSPSATTAATPNPGTATPPSAVRPTPRVSAPPQRDATAILGDVNRAVADAQLNQPPQATSFEQLRFKLEMFFNAGAPRTAAAIDDAARRANNLFLAIKAIGEANPMFNASFAQLLNALNADVLVPLGQLQADPVLPTAPSTPATQE
jgi:hypothetical protein